MVLTVLGVAVLGGIIGLDRTAAGQCMISQPIVAAPFMGWVLGDTATGMVIGAAFELIWVLDIPIGTFVPADSTIGAVSAVAVAAIGSPGGASLPAIGLSILLATALVPVTMKAEAVTRAWNSVLADRVLAAPDGSRGRALSKAQFAGMLFFFLKSFVIYLLFIPLGVAVLTNFGRLTGVIPGALTLFVKFLPLLGVVIVVRKLSMKVFDQFVFLGFATAALFGQVIHAPSIAVLLLTATAGWLGAGLRERRP